MASDLENLIDMGFDKSRAELAVKKGNLEAAMNWLEKTQDTPLDELLEEEKSAEVQAAAVDEGLTANSIVCNECGKKFRNMQLANFHAEKTGHADFAESTDELAPLTEEEKARRLQEMRDALAVKRAAQAVADKEEHKKNEKIRQKSTRESQDAKEDLRRKEQLKDAARKRQEKVEEQEAKQRIKAKIEADKEERRVKAERAKAQREGRPLPGAASEPAPAPAAPAAAARPAATHNEARLRLQTSGGNVMKTLPAETTLFEVAQMLESENGVTVTKFVMNFPRKTFEGSLDFGKTLKEAGLVPSAALGVQ